MARNFVHFTFGHLPFPVGESRTKLSRVATDRKLNHEILDAAILITRDLVRSRIEDTGLVAFPKFSRTSSWLDKVPRKLFETRHQISF